MLTHGSTPRAIHRPARSVSAVGELCEEDGGNDPRAVIMIVCTGPRLAVRLSPPAAMNGHCGHNVGACQGLVVPRKLLYCLHKHMTTRISRRDSVRHSAWLVQSS